MVESSTTEPALSVGIDIAARSVTACLLTPARVKQAVLTVEQNEIGFKQLAQRLDTTGLERQHIFVVVEATGVYWTGIVYFLHRAGFPVSLANPYRVRRYADSQSLDSKTDPLDAYVLAEYGLTNYRRLRVWHEPPLIYEHIYQLLHERYWLSSLRAQGKNRAYARRQRITAINSVERRTQEFNRVVRRQADQIEREIIRLMQQDTQWAASAQRLQSIPGIGALTAAWILCATQNFEFFDTAEQVVKYAGLAPRLFESGESIRKQRGLGPHGHARLRQALFMGALNAIRYNARLKYFYERLVARGKPKKVAVLAVARKLLVIGYALVKHETTYDPERQHPPNNSLMVS